MKNRLSIALLVLVLLALVAGTGGCGFLECGARWDKDFKASVSILSMVVSPPSGAGSFELSVTYSYQWDGTHSPEKIDCSFAAPNSNSVSIGNIQPSPSPLSIGELGPKIETSVLPFTVTPQENSVTPPGTYRAICSTPSNPGRHSINFTVTGEAADTTTPEIIVPADMTVEATGPAGVPVSFDVSATDLVDGPLTPTADPASGSVFPLGKTTVKVSAADKAGNPAGKSFTVTVKAAETPQQPALNGHWTGTFTYTSETGAPNYKTGVPMPMTLDITLDSQGQGTTVMFVDGSALGMDSKPGTVPASYSADGTLNFTVPSGPNSSATMRGQVSRVGSQLVIKGTWTYRAPPTNPSVVIEGTWQVAR